MTTARTHSSHQRSSVGWRKLLTAAMVVTCLGLTRSANAIEACLPQTQLQCTTPPASRPATSSHARPPLTPRRVVLPKATPMGLNGSAQLDDDIYPSETTTLPQLTAASSAHPAGPAAIQRRQRQLRDQDDALLLREIANVRRLLRQTPKNDPTHPRSLRRLAESYVELAESAHDAGNQQRALALVVGTINRVRAQLLRERAAAAASQERRARLKAVSLYGRLLTLHPNYCRFPQHISNKRRSCSDEVLRYRANELEKLHESEAALESYRQLLRDWPGSQHAPAAALAIAEGKFASAKRLRTNWNDVAAAYTRALRYRQLAPARRAYAEYKLAHTQRNANDLDGAISAFARSITLLQGLPSATNRNPSHASTAARIEVLLAASRQDLLSVYAQAGDPLQASAFFAPLSGDGPGQSASADAMVEALGQVMFQHGQLRNASRLYQQLATAEKRAAPRCRYAALATQAHFASEPGATAETLVLLRGLHETRTSAIANNDDEGAQTCAKLMWQVAGDTALAWHLETLGNDHASGTGNVQTLAAARTVFRWLTQLSNHATPANAKLNKRRAAVHYASAELAMRAQEHDACTHDFARALKLDPHGPRSLDAALGASSCWRAGHPDSEKLSPEQMRAKPHRAHTQATALALKSLDARACQRTVPRTAAAPSPSATITALAIANQRSHLHLAHGDIEMAAAIQRQLAFTRDDLAGIRAARTYLAGLRAFMLTGERPQCVATDQKDRARLRQRFCNKRPANEDVATRKQRLQLCRALR